MATSIERNEKIIDAFQSALGRYVMAVSNNESIFIAFLVLAMNDSTGADASMSIWFQFQSTRARLDMVRNAVRAVFGVRAPTRRVDEFVTRFKGLTRQRNYYVHAHYNQDPVTGAMSASGWNIFEGKGEVVRASTKPITKGMCNEITRSCDLLDELNHEMWKYLERLQKQLMRERKLSEPLIVLPPLYFEE